jgi:hypothetical protein
MSKKRKIYTRNENLGITDKLKCGDLKASLLQEFGVSEGTICDLMKEEDKLRLSVDKVDDKNQL